MRDDSPRMRLQKMARIDRELAATHARQATLLAERAELIDGQADQRIDMASGRKLPAPPEPLIQSPGSVVQARAREVLNQAGRRLRGAR